MTACVLTDTVPALERNASGLFSLQDRHDAHLHLRHHPARRQPGRGRQLLAAGQAATSPAGSTSWASTSSRAATRCPTPRTSSTSRRSASCRCKHARVAAFGMTRRKDVRRRRRHLPQGAARRRRRRSSPSSARPGTCTSARCSARRWKRTCAMIADSVAYCQAAGPRGVLRRRALLRRLPGTTPSTPCRRCGPPRRPGATVVILCDTNGGTLPERDRRRRRRGPPAAARASSASTATTTATWPWPTRWPPSRSGATQVQGTINGIGERCGNVDLVSVIANLALKRGYEVLQPGSLATADGGVALRLRDGEHELPLRPAVRRRQRLRPQGRHAHARRRPQRRPATSTSTRPRSATSAASWSASCRASRRILAKTTKYAHRARPGADGEDPRPGAGPGERGLRVRGGRGVVRPAGEEGGRAVPAEVRAAGATASTSRPTADGAADRPRRR